MVGYDFDKTILKEDSSLAFWMLVMKQNPTLGLKYGSKALTARNKWKKGKITREEALSRLSKKYGIKE